jgi:hypothetical protein
MTAAAAAGAAAAAAAVTAANSSRMHARDQQHTVLNCPSRPHKVACPTWKPQPRDRTIPASQMAPQTPVSQPKPAYLHSPAAAMQQAPAPSSISVPLLADLLCVLMVRPPVAASAAKPQQHPPETPQSSTDLDCTTTAAAAAAAMPGLTLA